MGFDDRDYSDTRRPRRSPRAAPPIEVTVWTGRQRLTSAAARDPQIVDRAREILGLRLERHAAVAGLWVHPNSHQWFTAPTDDALGGGLEIELTARLSPRTDGEWPSIHAAIREDQADREFARSNRSRIGDRLDALRGSVAVWASKTTAEVSKALSAPSVTATATVPGWGPPSRSTAGRPTVSHLSRPSYSDRPDPGD